LALPALRILILPGLGLLPFCHPMYENLYQGQLNLLLVLLVTAMWVLERSGHGSTAGLLLGVAGAIKLFPIYLAIYYAGQGRVRPLVMALLSFLSLTLITVLILGPESYHAYLGIVLPWNSEFRILGYNFSIAGLWHKLFYPVPGESIIPLWSSLALARWGTLLSNLIITAIVATLAYKAVTFTQRDVAFATTVTAMLLISPVTWDTSLPILLVPFALLTQRTITTRSPWLMVTLTLLLIINWAPQPILTELALAGRSRVTYSWTFMLGAPSLKFYALLATFGLGLAACWYEIASPRLGPANGEIVR
jgi:Glycosyltransferase family 87